MTFIYLNNMKVLQTARFTQPFRTCNRELYTSRHPDDYVHALDYGSLIEDTSTSNPYVIAQLWSKY